MANSDNKVLIDTKPEPAALPLQVIKSIILHALKLKSKEISLRKLAK